MHSKPPYCHLWPKFILRKHSTEKGKKRTKNNHPSWLHQIFVGEKFYTDWAKNVPNLLASLQQQLIGAKNLCKNFVFLVTSFHNKHGTRITIQQTGNFLFSDRQSAVKRAVKNQRQFPVSSLSIFWRPRSAAAILLKTLLKWVTQQQE